MAEMRVTADDITVKIELTKLGERLVAQGKIKAVRKVTPEMLKARDKAVEKARKVSAEHKKERIKKLKAAGKLGKLPPMTDREKIRVALLDERSKAHELAAKARAVIAKKAKGAKGKTSDERTN